MHNSYKQRLPITHFHPVSPEAKVFWLAIAFFMITPVFDSDDRFVDVKIKL
jgi:hypothetical protein